VIAIGNSFGWFAWALLAGALYLIIGVGFAPLSVPSVFFWRLAAWIVSAGVYAAHIGYEHFRIRSSLHSTALHVAFGAAIGAFGLAAVANVHSLLTGTGNLRLLRLALLIWPLITGVPAYVVAFVFTAVLFSSTTPSGGDIGPLGAPTSRCISRCPLFKRTCG